MAFDLKIQGQQSYKSIQLIDTNCDTIITIHCKGALMNSWKVKCAQHPMELILGTPNSATNDEPIDKIDENLSFEMTGFRSGKMSPFSCRIDSGEYIWADQQYKFNKFYLGAHAIHGLIYDADFEIRSSEVHEDFVQVLLGFDYQGTDPGFPFPYEIIVQWTLHQENLIGVKTTINNLSNHSIPIMDGWHPYFTLGGLVNDYTLKFISGGKIELNEALLPTGNIRSDATFDLGKKIGSTHLDDCYLLHPSKNQVTLSYNEQSITVIPKYNYPYLQIYTPDDRKSIAIENLSGAPNCFNNKMGLQILEPQGTIYFETSYQFNAASI
jgi:aldose 1-epimerase